MKVAQKCPVVWGATVQMTHVCEQNERSRFRLGLLLQAVTTREDGHGQAVETFVVVQGTHLAYFCFSRVVVQLRLARSFDNDLLVFEVDIARAPEATAVKAEKCYNREGLDIKGIYSPEGLRKHAITKVAA